MGVNIKKGIVIKALNNNMVLIKEQGVEKILLAKGIGFNKKFGDILEDNLEVDKVFSIEDKKNQENLKEVYNRVDGEFVAICEEALAEISEELGEELNETIHIGLIDHLSYEIAEGASKIIEETLDKKVYDDEVAYIAMHVERFRVALQK